MITGSNQILKWVLRIYGVRNITFNLSPKTNNQEPLVFFMEHDTIFSIKEAMMFRHFSISYRKNYLRRNSSHDKESNNEVLSTLSSKIWSVYVYSPQHFCWRGMLEISLLTALRFISLLFPNAWGNWLCCISPYPYLYDTVIHDFVLLDYKTKVLY